MSAPVSPPELVTLGALSAAVVALARGLEFLLTRWRLGEPPPTWRALTDRLTTLERELVLLQTKDAARSEQLQQILAWLARLDAKLDRLMARER